MLADLDEGAMSARLAAELATIIADALDPPDPAPPAFAVRIARAIAPYEATHRDHPAIVRLRAIARG